MKGEQVITATGEITLPDEIDDEGLALTVSTDVTVLAAKYIVAFDLNGASGTVPKIQMVEYNGIAISPESDPVREHYTFLGWYDGEDVFDFETPITGDLTLKAEWQIIEYEVTFISHDPDKEVSVTVNSGETVTAPDGFEKEGLILEGWYVDENREEKYNFDIPVTGDLTLYAKWAEDSELADAKNALTFADIKGENDIDTAVSKDLNLVNKLTDYPNVDITWTSDNPEVISDTGKVKQPKDNDVTVTLTATLTKGAESDSKEITVIVLKKGVEAGYGDYVDDLFAPGYPKSVINKNGTIDLVVKLVEPAELFVIFEVDNRQESVPYGVIRGHEGDYPYSRDSYYLNITNTEEQTIKTGQRIRDSFDTIIDFALRQGERTSEEVTTIKYDVKTSIELDVQAPGINLAAVNRSGDKIYLYFSELMDTTSKPKAEDFTLSSGNVTAIGEFTELEDSFFEGTYLELEVSGFKFFVFRSLQFPFSFPVCLYSRLRNNCVHKSQRIASILSWPHISTNP